MSKLSTRDPKCSIVESFRQGSRLRYEDNGHRVADRSYLRNERARRRYFHDDKVLNFDEPCIKSADDHVRITTQLAVPIERRRITTVLLGVPSSRWGRARSNLPMADNNAARCLAVVHLDDNVPLKRAMD